MLTTIQWTCQTTVEVIDDQPPMFTNCPGNDMTFNLNPGECCEFVNYPAIEAVDNCESFDQFMYAAIPPAVGGVSTFDMIYFDVVNNGTDPITITSFDQAYGFNVNNVQWEIYNKVGTSFGFETNAGAWTQVGATTIATPPGQGNFANLPVTPFVINPGETYGIAIGFLPPPGFPLMYQFPPVNTPTPDPNGVLQVNNGATTTIFAGTLLRPRGWIGVVNYEIAAITTIVQTDGTGFTTGDCFPIGTTFQEYMATDAEGNVNTCSFNVIVNEFPNPTNSLTCNDNVQVSLDENCSKTLGADDILEGGPYGCYDLRYSVMVLSPLGQPLGNTVDGSFIEGPWIVKVTDDTTGQSCWGSIIVKDKLPPEIECRDLTIDCGGELPSEPAPAFVGPNAMIIENIGEPLGEPGAPVPDIHSYDFDYSFYPPGTPVLDVDVVVHLIEHTWLPDLDIVATSPGGTDVDVFQVTGCFGAEFPIHCIFDDEGLGGLTMCAQLDANRARLQCFQAPGVQNNMVLDAFDGEDAGGIWQLTYTDNVAADDGVIVAAGLIITANAPAVAPSDNCDNNPTVTVEESYIDDSCGGPAGEWIRTWTAVDDSGNEATCTQTITVNRPALGDVEVPRDIKWTCTQYEIFPNIIEATPVHIMIDTSDCDPATDLLDATCYNPSCDDLDFAFQDNPNINSTSNGGTGCPGLGLDDADVLAVTGSGYPHVNGNELISICEIGIEYEDIIVQECIGSFKIIRQWTLVDWCSNPVEVVQLNQVIKVVDEEAPIIELLGVDGEITSNYGNAQIPAFGNYGNPTTTGGCGPDNGTVFTALFQIPGTGAAFNPDQFTNIELESVLLTLSHENVDDLDIFLRGPSDKVIELSTDNGMNGLGYYKTKFVDDLNVPVISTAAAPFTGRYRPEGTLDISCGGFNGTVATLDDMITNWQADALGTWELIIFDDDADNVGQIIEWKLNFSAGDITLDVYNANATGSIHTVCEGSVHVPPVQDCTDNCSGIDHYITELWTMDGAGDPEFQIGTIAGNGGYFDNIPMFENGLPARYILRYTAVDGCKNQTSLDVVVRLRDKVPPVAICDEITEVAITNNGQNTGDSCSELFAEDLDDGSYDNCSPVYFLMAKMDDSFSQDIYNRCYYPSRDFCCDDIGDQTVIVLVLDQDPEPLFNTTITSPALGCDEPTPNTPSLFLSPNGINATVPGSQQLIPVNFNTCMVTVQVTDKIPPILQSCPANERVSCDWYAEFLETQLANAADDEEQCDILSQYFGDAVYLDNCADNIECTVNVNLDQCLEGTIRRTWHAEDNQGNGNNSQNCNQTIFVDHVSDFVVEFPADLTVECGNDVPDFGEPEIFYETCELVAVSYDDQVYVDVDSACYKIERQWTVINWCVVGDEIDEEVKEDSELDMRLAGCLSIINLECDLDGDGDCDDRTFRDSWAICTLPDAAHANPPFPFTGPDTDDDSDVWDGYITYEQIIKVNDTVDPDFTNGCQIPDVCISDNTCAATVLLPTPDIDECSEYVTFTYNILIGGVWLDGAGPYLNVGPGQYPVRYVASDNCNNQTACETTLNVVDCKKPTPYCKAGIVVTLMPVNPPMVQVWANDLDDNSFDNCPGALKFSFSADVDDIGRTYTCDDLGQNTVEIWVTDAAGNQDFCTTTIIIQEGVMPCPSPGGGDPDDPIIAGQTATEQSEGVDDVTININSPSGFDATVNTAGGGIYGQAVQAGGDYTVTPVHDVDPLNGVTTYDLVVISKHILGVDLLDSPYQIIAADANKSNTVTTFDLVELRKLILFINTEFPNNTSWRFVDESFAFPDPTNPFASQFPEVINLNNVTDNQLTNDFVAVKIGDVNGSASVNFADAEDRTMVGDLVLNTEDAVLTEGETYTVEFKATDFAVSGYQFTLNFDNDALTFNGVESALANESNFGLAMVNEGVITTSWNSNEVKTLATDEVVFGLTFTAKQSGRLSELLSINSRYTVAEAYNANAELLNVALSFNNTLVAEGFELYQNTPNPFATTTTIGFHLPEATSATLTISDVQGKVLKVINGEYIKGYNQEVLKRSELGATGVLYYRLDTETDSATRMMILVD